MGTLRWLPIRCYFHWLMSLFLRLLLLQDWCYFICSACTKAKILPFKYVAKNPELIHDTPDSAKDFDSPICLACTTATICLACTTAKTIFKMRLTEASFMPTKISHWSLLRKEVRIYVHGGFCWFLSYWFLLSLKDTNNKALSLYL